MVSTRTLQILVASVVDAGVPRDTFLRAAKLDPAYANAPDGRVPRSKLFELFELAVELTGDPALGLHSIERLTDDAVNPLARVGHPRGNPSGCTPFQSKSFERCAGTRRVFKFAKTAKN